MLKTKFSGILGVLVLLAIIFIGCPDGGGSTAKTVKVTGVTLKAGESTSGESTIYLGSTQAHLPASITLTATVEPANATNKTVKWKVEPTTYVNLSGTTNTSATVTAKALGKSKVTVTTADGAKIATWDITVADPTSYVAVETVTITSTGPFLFTKAIGSGTFSPATIQLEYAITPPNATEKGVSWESSDDSVATVSGTGLVTPLKNGTVEITIISDDDPTIIDQVSIRVNDESVEDVHVTGVAIVFVSTGVAPVGDLTFNKPVGGEFEPEHIHLSVTVTPNDASDKTVAWASSDATVASVTGDGLVTPLKAGNAIITATSNDNNTKTSSVNVVVTVEEAAPVYTLKLVNQSATPADGTTLTLPDMDATTKRFTVANAFTGSSDAGWSTGTATTGVTGTTVVYFDKVLGNNASISARVRITQAFGGTANSGGLVMGMFSNPVGATNIQFCGIRAGTDKSITIYATRDSSGISNSSTAFSPALTSDFIDDEYIITITRTGATAYSLKIDDTNGTNLRNGTRSGTSQIIDLGNVYPGFIIARAKVEISQITITEGTGADNVIYQSAASAPTVYPVDSVSFTAPTVTATANPDEYTCGYSLAGGSNLTISAAVAPARATDKTITWEKVSGTATLSASTGNSVTATFSVADTVVITASAGGKSAQLTIDVSAGATLVNSISLSIAGNRTSMMAGNGTVLPQSFKVIENVLPGDATDKSVTWSLSSTSAYANTTTVSGCSISSAGILTAPANYIGADFPIYVFAKANDGSNIVSNGMAVIIKQYDPVIFWWKNGEPGHTITGAINTSSKINGVDATRLNGTFSINSSGDIVFGATGRLVIGSVLGQGTISTTDPTKYFDPNGQFDLSRKFKVSVIYTVTATSANFRIGFNVNDTSGNSSVLGSGVRIQSNPGAVGTVATLTATWDPATLKATSAGNTWFVDYGTQLKNSFIFFGTESSTSGTISEIKIEYIDN